MVSSLVGRALKLLSVPVNKKWTVKPYVNVSELLNDLRQLEMRYFQDLDGTMLMKNYFLSAHGLYSFYVTLFLFSLFFFVIIIIYNMI